jgi:hypothetical protein
MDEIFGFFPPTKNPPSKEPMLLLLKQARAFGIGVVLSTQNPVDLDYKGLSNIGTWFVGRLQTTQDIDRVIDGLGGKVGSSFDRDAIRQLLVNLPKRTFFLKSAHLDDIRLFETRWVMSYLKGPLSREEISRVMETQKQQPPLGIDHLLSAAAKDTVFENYQNIDPSIPQFYEPDILESYHYYPTLGAIAKVHFVQQARGIDQERILHLSLPLNSAQQRLAWNEANDENHFEKFPHMPPGGAKFASLPDIILKDKGLKQAIRELKETLYREQNLQLYRCTALMTESKAYESKSDFLVRVQDSLQAQKEAEIEKLKIHYAAKEKVLQEKLFRANERIERESSDSTGSMIEAGIAVLGALFGRSSSAKIGRAVSKGSKIFKERGEMKSAHERAELIKEEINALEREFEDKADVLNEKYHIDRYGIETVALKPRKTDIDIELCAIVWRNIG